MGSLKPALAVSLAGMLLSPAVQAADLASRFLSCTQIGRPAGRLACYDRVAAEARGTAAAQRPDFVPGKPLRPPAETMATGAPAAPAAVTVGLSSVGSDADGKPIFRLEDGQVWRGEEEDPVYANPTGNIVTIRRSALGLGYRLQMNQETRRFTVKRVE